MGIGTSAGMSAVTEKEGTLVRVGNDVKGVGSGAVDIGRAEGFFLKKVGNFWVFEW
jgi:hypothetical protein